MADAPNDPAKAVKPASEEREARLAAALRANLRRRKAAGRDPKN
jgi:hypothetical protein